MNKEDYYKRIEDKLDKQTHMLLNIKMDIVEEVNFLKLAHQRLKYAIILNSALIIMVISIEYPRLMKILKGII